MLNKVLTAQGGFPPPDSPGRRPAPVGHWRVRAGREQAGVPSPSHPSCFLPSAPLPSPDVAASVQVTQHQRGAGEAVPDSTRREPLPFPGPPPVPALCCGGELGQPAGLWLRAGCGRAQLHHEVSPRELKAGPRTGLQEGALASLALCGRVGAASCWGCCDGGSSLSLVFVGVD